MGQVKVVSTPTAERRVVAAIRGRPASDGAGVKLTRVIGQPALPDLDPFLMLDEFGSDKGADYIGGFPDHPHRGFETVTYMLAGRMRHGDNQGNVGLLRPGSVQWMTAGRGIIHSEMPEQEEGLMQGFQLWVNLPAKDKMVKPRYQDIDPENVPVVERADGTKVKVLVGSFDGVSGPVNKVATDPLYLDITLPAGVKASVPVEAEHNGLRLRVRRHGEDRVGGAAGGAWPAGGAEPRRWRHGRRRAEGRPPDPGRRPAAARAGGEIRGRS
jgi:redox-sensitive bicupin YhaK (pirin superfamily)